MNILVGKTQQPVDEHSAAIDVHKVQGGPLSSGSSVLVLTGKIVKCSVRNRTRHAKMLSMPLLQLLWPNVRCNVPDYRFQRHAHVRSRSITEVTSRVQDQIRFCLTTIHTPLQQPCPRQPNPEPLPVQLVVVPSSGEFQATGTVLFSRAVPLLSSAHSPKLLPEQSLSCLMKFQVPLGTI